MTNIEKELQTDPIFIPAVVGFLCKEDKVLLGLRKKVSNGLGLNIVGGIGGKVGDTPELKNETHDEALVREIQEEICVIPTEFKKMGRVRFIWPEKRKWQQDVLIYIVTKWEGEPQETEAIKPDWYFKNELPVNQLWKDNTYWVPRILGSETIDAVFLLDKDAEVLEYKYFGAGNEKTR